MENWKEFIERKFLASDGFTFETEEFSNTLYVRHNSSGTYFAFHWPDEKWLNLADVRYQNIYTDGWSGEFGEVAFCEDAVKRVEQFILPAFNTGWSSKDIYLFGKHFKSIVSENLEGKGPYFYYYSGDLGCLSIILWPVLEILALTVAEVRIVKVKPIKSYQT